MLDLPVFIASTPKALYDLLPVITPHKATGQPDPEKMKSLLASHPESAKAFQVNQKQQKSSGFDNSFYLQ